MAMVVIVPPKKVVKELKVANCSLQKTGRRPKEKRFIQCTFDFQKIQFSKTNFLMN